MDAEIIAVGSEMLTAHGQDTNSLYLTDKLNALGIEVRFKTVVGDNQADLSNILETAIKRSPLVIVTGGLGPTEDDLTREALSSVCGRALRENSEIRARIEKRFQRLGREMPPNNLRQALVPEGAEWIENTNGSAPGLWLEQQGAVLILLPGPPWELEAMFDAACMPRLERFAGGKRIRSRVYKVIGLPESEVDRRIAPLYKTYDNPVTTILAKPGAIEVHLRARAASDAEAEAMLSELGDKLELALGDQIFSTRGETLEEVVGIYLAMKRVTIAVAESCTGGLLSQRLTSIAGSSSYFLGGAVCYSNALKVSLAGVSAHVLEEYGAVSKQVAAALSEGIRRRSGAAFGIGITGVAGPGGGSPEKPVGVVFIGLAHPGGVVVKEFRFPGPRERIRYWASQMALEMIRRHVRD